MFFENQVRVRRGGTIGSFSEAAALELPGVFSGNHSIDRRRNKNIARKCEEFLWINTIVLGKRPQVSLLQHMLFGGFDVYSLGVIKRGVRVADPDDLDATFVRQRQSRYRTDVAESLHNGGALFRIYFQHVHGALNQVNNAAPGRFTPALGTPDRDRLAGNDFVYGVAHVNGVRIHEPSHDLFVRAHVGSHDVSVRADERNHFLHVTARDRLQLVAR